MKQIEKINDSPVSRRSFLKGGSSLLGAAALLPAAGLIAGANSAHAQDTGGPAITAGDINILRFLAALEIIDDDIFSQYTEVSTSTITTANTTIVNNNNRFNQALRLIDPALPQYVAETRRDERSHANFINAFLGSIGEFPANLDAFRTLPSVTASGAGTRRRLTNLRHVTVDTSFFLRYRRDINPDFGDTAPQIATIVNTPTIPPTNGVGDVEIFNIAQSAAFHFAFLEQADASLYSALLSKVTNLDALAILASIGPTEFYRFAVFQTSLENIVTFPGGTMVTALGGTQTRRFPNLKNNPALAQSVMPAPCKFLRGDLPICSVLRPRSIELAGAVASFNALVQSGIFTGQSNQFFTTMTDLAAAADAAQRGI
ncbi:MAG: hypothetical protein JWQ71_2615 [Pedosphaera sp.]|nr:hypothetical protein [Pedosphaera sp.]